MVPRTIAENSGLNATDAVAALYQAHASGQSAAGLDVETGGAGAGAWGRFGLCTGACGGQPGFSNAWVVREAACVWHRPPCSTLCAHAVPAARCAGGAKDLGAEGVYDLYSTKWSVDQHTAVLVQWFAACCAYLEVLLPRRQLPASLPVA